MKKRTIFLTMLVVLLALFAVSLSRANAASNSDVAPAVTSSGPDKTIEGDKGTDLYYAANGGVAAVKDIKHGDSIVFTYETAIEITADTYIHIKGHINDKIYRMRLCFESDTPDDRIYDDQGYFFASDKNDSQVKLRVDADGYFTYNAKVLDMNSTGSVSVGGLAVGKKIGKITFQVYTIGNQSGSGYSKTDRIGDMQVLGIAFDNNATYDGFASLDDVLNGGSGDAEPDDGTLKVSDIVSYPSTATVTKEGTDQVIKYSEVSGWATYKMEVTNYDSKYSDLTISFTSSHSVAICVVVNGNTTSKHTVYEAGDNTIIIDLKEVKDDALLYGELPANFALELFMDVGDWTPGTVDENTTETVTLHSVTFTEPAPLPEPEPDDGSLKLSDLSLHANTGDAVITKDGTDQIITYGVKDVLSYSQYAITVKNYDVKYSVFEVKFSTSAAMTICYEMDGKIDWSYGHKNFPAGTNQTFTIDLSASEKFNALPSNFTLVIYLDGEVAAETSKTVTFHSIEYKEPDPVIEEPDDGSLKIGEIASHPKATVSKNEEGQQVLTYSERPGWTTFDMLVKHFDQNPAANTVLEVKFTASAPVTFELYVNNVGGYDHNTYAANKVNTVLFDISGMDLPEEFTISMYIDAPENVVVTETKTVTILSVAFVEPAPEPEGMFLTVSKDGSITVVETEEGWDISYTPAATWQGNEYRSVKFTVNNYEAGYDVVHVKLNLTAGTNVCIWVNYADGSHAAVKDHWAGELVAAESKVYDLGFLMSAYGKAEGAIASIVVYFDNPTQFTTNTTAVEAQILAVELLKSSDLTLSDVTFTVEGTTMDYNGSRPTLTITNVVTGLDYRYEFRAAGSEGEWHLGLPTDAGVYEVRVSFMGSLEYNPYSADAVTVTINKIAQTAEADGVTIDAATRVVTIKEGYEASLDEDFATLLEDGDTVNYGQVVYYRKAEDANHNASEALTTKVDRPVQEEPKDETNDETNDENNGESQVTPEPQPEKKGCGGSVVASLFAMVALCGAVVIFKKREE